jgi:signal transduction histidine kinase
MSEIIQLNVVLLYFVYGLSFYTMGVAIALQYRSYSSIRMAHSLSLLAAFALLHGLSEWGSVFIPAKVPDFGDFPLWKLVAMQRMLQSVSYFFLFIFGAKLIADSRNRGFYWWIILPTAAFVAWLVYFSRFIYLVGSGELINWLVYSEYWSRYLLAFPAGVVTAYGLYLQAPEVQKISDKSVLINLRAATVAFSLFALFSGLVVPHEFGWLGRVINADKFRFVTGLPIELFRTATALLATWSITSMLAVFDLEKQRQVTESRRLEAVYRERERFARDLHDDVIQSIYGVGLQLQTTIPLIEKDPDRGGGQVALAVRQLNKVIHTLRAYIHGLNTQENGQELQKVLENMVEQFRKKTGLMITLDYRLSDLTPVSPVGGGKDWRQELQQVIREALNNVVRHAGASSARVDIGLEGQRLVVTVEDNGLGLPAGDDRENPHPSREGGLGLSNMRARAALLGGGLEIFSRPGEGTRLVISIPVD